MSLSFLAELHLYPGEAGWGDVLFVGIWAIGSLLLAAYYVYRAFVGR